MTGRFCSKCGSEIKLPARKFCSACGATLPEPAPSAATGAREAVPAAGSGIPVRVLEITFVLVLGIAVILLIPYFAQMFNTPLSGLAGAGDSFPQGQSPGGTSQTGIIAVPTTGIPVTSGNQSAAISPGTTATTLVPVSPPATVPATQVSTTTRTPTPKPATTVPTMVPKPRSTSIISMPVTHVPPQPPVSSYTSSIPGAPYIDPSALEYRVHQLINVQREQNGLSTLSYDSFLADISRGHSWDMVTRNFFEHENPDGKDARARGDAAGYPCLRDMGTYTYEGIAENLFQGYRYTSYTTTDGVITSYNWSSVDDVAERAVNGWMDSPGHRKNILTEHFILEGIGVAFSPDNKILITENFC